MRGMDTAAADAAPSLSHAKPARPALLPAEMCDPAARRRYTDQALDGLGNRYPIGTLARSRFLLAIIQTGHPTPRTQAAYLENLHVLLRHHPPRDQPGRLVIGLGTGRSGSTTLSHILVSCGDVCATHENPPMLYWAPQPEQIAFHLARFALLRRHLALVADIAHWWINATEELVAAFPDVRFIGTWRERSACVDSFLRIKGVGPGSLNHWLLPGCDDVAATNWDLSYPSYPVADPAFCQQAEGKRQLIARYVDDYNAHMLRLAAADPRRWLLLRTESLNAPETRQRIFAHAGAAGSFAPVRLNAGTTADGESAYHF